MKYCRFTSYFNYTDTEYPIAILCDDRIYNFTPDDATPYRLLSPSLEGYSTTDEMGDAIGSALGFPVGIYRDFYCMSADGKEDDEFNFWLDEFGLTGEATCKYDAPMDTYVCAIAYPGQSHYNIGNVWIPDVGGGSVFIGSTNIPNNGFTYLEAVMGMNCADMLYFVDPAVPNHFRYMFTIFPENMIMTSKFELGALKHPDPNNVDVLRYCRVIMECWQYQSGELEGKYNCTISIIGVNRNTTNERRFIDGKPTGNIWDTKNPGLVIKPPKKNEGGEQDTDPNTPPVTIPDPPSNDMTDAGSIRLYTVDAANVKALFTYLHSNAPGDAILKWFGNPIQGIISLHYLPYAIQHKANTGAENVQILGIPTGVMAQPAAQFQTINFGSTVVPTDSDTYLSYSPYTKCSIYLPGIGIREINIDDVNGKRVWVVYNCDNCTGQFMAYIATSKPSQGRADANVRYVFCGQVAAPFPISQENWGNTFIAGATLAAGALAGGVAAAGAATAGAGAGAAAGSAAGTAAGAAEAGAAGGSAASGLASGAVNIGNSLTNLAKPTITRSGAVSGTTSLFAVKKPYLIIERPNWQSFAGFQNVKGYPYGRAAKLGDLSGYAVIESVHLTGVPATVGEINEIESLLKSGVIL